MNILHWTYLTIVWFLVGAGFYYVNPTQERLIAALILIAIMDFSVLCAWITHKPKKKKKKAKNLLPQPLPGEDTIMFAGRFYRAALELQQNISTVERSENEVTKYRTNYYSITPKPSTEQGVYDSVEDMLNNLK